MLAKKYHHFWLIYSDGDGFDAERWNTHRLSCLLADLTGGGLSLDSWRLSDLLLDRCRRLTGGGSTWRRLSRWLLTLTGLLATSRALGCRRAGWSLGRLLGGSASSGERRGLLRSCRLCLRFDVSLCHRWHSCCCCLCSWGCCRLQPQTSNWHLLLLHAERRIMLMHFSVIC